MDDRTVIDPQIPPPGAGEATRVLGAPGFGPAPGAPAMYGEATQQSLVVTCPVCQTPNGPAERYCQDCGLLLSSISGEVEPLPDLSQLPRLIDSTGREFPLNPGPNSVGRDSADILLPDPTVSRRHAQVTLEGEQVWVEDQGSTNGTSVGGHKLAAGERAGAYQGDTVKFGSIVLTLALPGAAARPAAVAPSAAVPAAAPADRGPALAALVLADGTEHPLFAGVNTIGRRSGNQIVLSDAFMSGKHAEVTVTPEGAATLVDVGSTNGSFLAGQRLAPQAPVELAEGTVVVLGKTQVTCRAGAPSAPPAAESTVMLETPPEEPILWDTQVVRES